MTQVLTQPTPCLIALDPAVADPTPHVDAAAPYAAALAEQSIVLGVVDPRAMGDSAGPSPAEARARAALDITAAQLRRRGVSAAPLLRAGPVDVTVVDAAARHNASVVILGAPRGDRHALRRWLTSRRPSAIGRRVTCPTLRVPAARPEEADSRAAPDTSAPGPGSVRSFHADLARAGDAIPHSLGPRTVEVARIVGSVDRAAHLDERFRERSGGPRGAARYGQLLDLVEQADPLPPVELYKLGYGYYLLDGHRRVAAALEVGQLWIDATVVEFVPLAGPGGQRAVAARRAFECTTGVTQIDASLPDTYPRLEELVRDFATRHAIDDLREAGARWYARTFQPARSRLRAARAHERFPGHTTADIVARLVPA